MEYKKYHKIMKLGSIETDGILQDGDIYIFEKIDGANVQIRMIEEDGIRKLTCGKRTNWINEEDGQFSKFYDWVMKHESFQDLPTELIIYGEFLKKHTIDYPVNKLDKFYMFDVYSIPKEAYLPYEDIEEIAKIFNLEYIKPLYVGKYQSMEHLMSFVGYTDFGAEKGEGIVIKNYGFRNRFGKQCYAKIVAEDFREKLTDKIHKEKSANQLNEKDMCRDLITKARVLKIRNKGKNNELPESVEFTGDMRDMRWIPQWIYEDMLDEDLRYIANKFHRVDYNILKKTIPGFVAPILKEVLNEKLMAN